MIRSHSTPFPHQPQVHDHEMPGKARTERAIPDRMLLQIADTVRLCAWASSYCKQSSCAFNRFCRTCAAHGWPVFPVTEKTLLLYAAFRYYSTHNGGASFRTELYNIRQALGRLGTWIDISEGGPMKELNQFCRGWKRLRGPKFKRKPITSEILRRFFEHLDPRNTDHQTIRAALAVAKFGMMRVSEYTYGTNCNNPQVDDVRLFPDAMDARFMALYFSHSKRNQGGRTERVVCVCTCPEPCPVHETIRMLNSRPSVMPEDRLFRFASGGALTPKFMNGIIKKLCKLCGLDPEEFIAHCLRKGGITDTLCTGVPDSIVQLLSRHASLESLKPYKLLSDENLGTILSSHLEAHRKKN